MEKFNNKSQHYAWCWKPAVLHALNYISLGMLCPRTELVSNIKVMWEASIPCSWTNQQRFLNPFSYLSAPQYKASFSKRTLNSDDQVDNAFYWLKKRFFESSASAYWNVNKLPIVETDVSTFTVGPLVLKEMDSDARTQFSTQTRIASVQTVITYHKAFPSVL